MRRTACAGTVALCGLPAAAGAFERAQPGDPYEVHDVSVAAVADNAVAAKKLAFQEALSSAARRVLDRVAVDAAGLEIGPEEAETLLSMVRNTTERFGPGGYSATLTMRFDPRLVRDYLNRRGIRVVDPGPAEPVSGAAVLNRNLPQANLHVRVLLPGGPAEWELLKRRLESSGVVDGITVTDIGETGGDVTIRYAGRLDQLPDRLARTGLDLFEAGGGWLLQAY